MAAVTMIIIYILLRIIILSRVDHRSAFHGWMVGRGTLRSTDSATTSRAHRHDAIMIGDC